MRSGLRRSCHQTQHEQPASETSKQIILHRRYTIFPSSHFLCIHAIPALTRTAQTSRPRHTIGLNFSLMYILALRMRHTTTPYRTTRTDPTYPLTCFPFPCPSHPYPLVSSFHFSSFRRVSTQPCLAYSLRSSSLVEQSGDVSSAYPTHTQPVDSPMITSCASVGRKDVRIRVETEVSRLAIFMCGGGMIGRTG
jgi:hypothetical protein